MSQGPKQLNGFGAPPPSRHLNYILLNIESTNLKKEILYFGSN